MNVETVPRAILVTGDIFRDHYVYEGQESRPNSLIKRGAHYLAVTGGAHLLHALLEAYHQQCGAAQAAWRDKHIEEAQSAADNDAKRKGQEPKPISDERRRAIENHVPFHDGIPAFGLSDQELISSEALTTYAHLQTGAVCSPCAADPSPRDEQSNKKPKVWRIKQTVGYGSRRHDDYKHQRFFERAAVEEVLHRKYSVWVLDDAGADFRDRRSAHAWPSLLRDGAGAAPEWIVLKMSAPMASGDLWLKLTKSPVPSSRSGRPDDPAQQGAPLQDRMVVVVSAEDLRCESALISREMSWERTALDLTKALGESPALRQLAACRYLIVLFGADGAALVDGRKPGDPCVHLIFDPTSQEGDWAGRIDGDVVGKTSCFVAGIVSRLPPMRAEKSVESQKADSQGSCRCEQSDSETASLTDGIRAGLRAVRRLLLCGHGCATAQDGPDLPLRQIACELLDNLSMETGGSKPLPTPEFVFDHVAVPKNVTPGLGKPQSPGDASRPEQPVWRILEGSPHRPLGRAALTLGQARLVAQFGLRKLSGVPYLSIGDLRTVDRGEIENLRTIRQLVQDYRANAKADRPLSLGVFGQPGAGKSFGVKQLAKAVLDNPPILEFNLSQLSIDDDSVLIGAFHQIRDKVLEGKTPFVLWDEFDAKGLHWLAKVLAPMQDGKFLEGQMTHPIGKCIFVFAGGTSYDFASFGPPELSSEQADSLSTDNRKRLSDEQQRFREQKGPDFKSRLTAHLNVSGPNSRKERNWIDDCYVTNATDTGHSLRRALLLRAQLRLKDDEIMQIDPALLTALLEVPEYKHGARSMEKLLEYVKVRSGGRRLMPSHIPPDEILDLHVDAGAFRRLLEQDLEFQRMAEVVAPYIHAAFVKHVTRSGHAFHERVKEDYRALDLEMQESNIAAARRMPDVLKVAGLKLVKNDSDDQATSDGVKDLLEERNEIMAEMEHTGWMEFHFRNQWSFDPVRCDSEKQHDCLQAFAKLSRENQDKDRGQVRMYPDFAASAGFHIEESNAPESGQASHTGGGKRPSIRRR